MPHLNAKEEEAKEDSAAKESGEVHGTGDNKEETKEDASTRPKKDSSPTASKSSEEAAHRWPPYPPHGARHPPPPYYGYDYPGWGHHPPPPHGDPYARSRRSYPPRPPTSPVRREPEGKESPAKGSPEASQEDRAAARAYEEAHGYPPHPMHRPPYAAYGMPPPYGYPPPEYYEEHYRAAEEARLARKRRAEKESSTDEAPTKRVRLEEKPEEKPVEEEETKSEESEKSADEEEKEESNDEASKEEDKPAEEEEEKDKAPEDKPEKAYAVDKDGKRVISPTSSLDGTHKGDDSTSLGIQQKLSGSSSGSFPPGEPRPPSSSYDPYYPPPEAYPYGASRGAYPPPPYYPHPMYAGYPPPPPHYYRDHPPPPGYYDPPSPRSSRYHARDYPPPPRGYGGPHPIHGSFESAGSKTAGEGEKEGHGSPSGSSREPSPREEVSETAEVPKKIKSVSDWRAAAMATGMAPSANRCVPLQEPIPSKCWGTPEHAETIVIPDFHRLVNYPDYLIKNYPDYLRKTRPKGKSQVDKDGKRHCVMCGQGRLCSASSAKSGPSSRVRTPKFANALDEETDETTGTTHIIPRQNKGLCTACDVTVWVIADSHIEIKWCKGCKNFRPWAAFGDKGMATKCVRCRDRQREKYASQKDKLRTNRQNKKMTETKDGQHEIAAAKGLQDLMSASMAAV